MGGVDGFIMRTKKVEKPARRKYSGTWPWRAHRRKMVFLETTVGFSYEMVGDVGGEHAD